MLRLSRGVNCPEIVCDDGYVLNHGDKCEKQRAAKPGKLATDKPATSSIAAAALTMMPMPRSATDLQREACNRYVEIALAAMFTVSANSAVL